MSTKISGPSYNVLTDDHTIFAPDTNDLTIETHRQRGREALRRYDGLFSAVISLLFLPAMFISEHVRVQVSRFATELQTDRGAAEVKAAIAEMGQSKSSFDRSVQIMCRKQLPDLPERVDIDPPNLHFAAKGYWRALTPGEVGQDAAGGNILGKTWVRRSEAGTAGPLSRLVATVKMNTPPAGVDPGYIYVVRSGSHYADVYKIGLTRRNAGIRASELSGATGVPLPFDVLATWAVANCVKVEAQVHALLKPFRVSSRREFFKADLGYIISMIQTIVAGEGRK
jgi:hypothetical protein